MVPSPITAVAADAPAEGVSHFVSVPVTPAFAERRSHRGAASPSERSPCDRSPTDFSFGTTQPLVLPVFLPQAAPCQPADNVHDLEDEFTFGTTAPLVLPDLTHVPKDFPQTGKSPSCGSSDSASNPLKSSPLRPRTSPPRSSPPVATTPPGSPDAPSYYGYDQYNASPSHLQMQAPHQVGAQWSPQALSPYLASHRAAQGYWPSPPAMESVLEYSASPVIVSPDAMVALSPYIPSQVSSQFYWASQPVVGSALDHSASPDVFVLHGDVWDKPSPMMISPASPPEGGTPEGAPEACDLEKGGNEALDDDISRIHELSSRSAWSLQLESKFGSRRRLAAALCIFLLVICIAALVSIICVDPGGSST